MDAGSNVVAIADDARVQRLATALPDVTVVGVPTTDDGLALLETTDRPVACLVTDHDPPDRDCFALLDAETATPVVVAPTAGSSRLASDALAAGATDYVDPETGENGDGLTALADRVATVIDAESAPARQPERYEQIVEAVGDPVYTTDAQGRLTFVNQAVVTVTGYDEDELLGEFVGTFMTDDYMERASSLIVSLLTGEARRGTLEGEIVTKDGGVIPVENHVTLLPADEGGFQGIAGVIRDITDRERRLAELEQYETIVETVPDGVFVLDEEACIVGGNERGATMLGFEKENLLGTRIPDLIDRGIMEPSVVDEYAQSIPDLLSTETERETARFEFRACPADADEDRVFEARIALRPYDDVFRGSIGVLRDVTERNQRIEELERYETIIDAVPDTVYAVDEDGYFTFVNESSARDFGYTPEEIETGDVHFADTVLEADVPKIREATRELLSSEHETSRKATVEYTAVTRDGRRYPAENHFAVMPTNDGVAAAGISRDVSERQQRKRRIEVLNRVLRHNLRNELNAIMNLADSLTLDSDDPSVVEQRARKIKEIGDGLAAMSDRLRKLAATTDHQSADDTWVDAVAIVERAVTSVSVSYPDAEITTDVPDCLPVVGTGVLETAVVELLENAIEHNDRDPPHVEITVTESDRDGWVDLIVADDGPGIPDDERRAVTSDEITPLEHGSGLGLWTVVWIVESFHGDVDIREREPRGTAVVARLKRRYVDE